MRVHLQLSNKHHLNTPTLCFLDGEKGFHLRIHTCMCPLGTHGKGVCKCLSGLCCW